MRSHSLDAMELYHAGAMRRKAFTEIKWYVIRTWSCYENRAAEILRKFGIEVYIPLVHYGWLVLQDKSYLLCPNLLFVKTTADNLICVLNRLDWPKYMTPYRDRTRPHDKGWMQFLTVPDYEMKAFVLLTEWTQPYLHDEEKLSVNLEDHVLITEGRWTGFQGLVKDINPSERLALIQGFITTEIKFTVCVPFEGLAIQERRLM